MARYRAAEVVSSDALREVVGSGPADLDASVESFDLLDRIVAARARRRLTVVVDTLGLDPVRRAAYLAVARSARLPAIAVVVDTAASVCRARNTQRDRPVPAPVLTQQLRRMRAVVAELEGEGWDIVHVVTEDSAAPESPPAPAPAAARRGAVSGVGGPGSGVPGGEGSQSR